MTDNGEKTEFLCEIAPRNAYTEKSPSALAFCCD